MAFFMCYIYFNRMKKFLYAILTLFLLSSFSYSNNTSTTDSLSTIWWNYFSMAKSNRKDSVVALNNYNKALSTAKLLNDSLKIIRSGIQKTSYLRNKDFAKRDQEFKQFFKMANEIKGYKYFYYLYIKYAELLYTHNHFNTALTCLTELEDRVELTPTELYVVYHKRSLYHFYTGQIDLAEICWNKSTSLYNLLYDKNYYTTLYQIKGDIEYKKENYDLAEEYYLKQIKYAKNFHKPFVNLPYIYNRLGDLYLFLEKDNTALNSYRTSYRISKQDKNEYYTLLSLLDLVNINLQINNLDSASYYLTKIKEREISLWLTRESYFKLKGDFFRQSGKVDSAIIAYRKAINYSIEERKRFQNKEAYSIHFNLENEVLYNSICEEFKNKYL